MGKIIENKKDLSTMMVVVLKSFRVDGIPGVRGLSQRPAYPDGIRRGQQRQPEQDQNSCLQRFRHPHMAHVQEIAEDAVSTLQRADVVGK